MYWEHLWHGKLVRAGFSYLRMDAHHAKFGLTTLETTLGMYTANLTPGFLCRACFVGTAVFM